MKKQSKKIEHLMSTNSLSVVDINREINVLQTTNIKWTINEIYECNT